MAQLQWLGTAPPRQKSMVGEAIRGGFESYMGAREKAKEREVRLEEISFDKKQKAADMIMKQTEYATPEQKKQIVATQAGDLVKDVYGEETFNTWAGVSGKGKASQIAEVKTWIQLKGKPSQFDKYGIRLKKSDMDREISFKLDDADWKTTYPDLATSLETSYKEKPEGAKKKAWWQKTDYKGMSDVDLHARTLAGDREAIAEAKRRGY